MLQPFPNRLSDVAAAIADGDPLDWAALESSAGSDEERMLVRRFKTISEIAHLHSTGVLIDSQLVSIETAGISGAGRNTPLVSGSSWGHLQILEEVGQGRYGIVYRAWDPRLEREVALKLLRDREGASGSEVVHEGRLMARVHHPNVVTVYGAESREGQVGIWMEFIHGRTLEAELMADGPFAAEKLIEAGTQLCAALAAVHAAGLVHRDVKPQNVLRDRNGRLVLGDFGTGRLLDDVGEGVAGTPLFLAPELLDGAPASERSDVYALGVTMYHLATHSFPVVGRSISDLRDAHDRDVVPKSLASVRPEMAAPIVELIDRALARAQEDRWPSAATMRASLDGTPPTVSRRRRRTTMVAAALGVIALVAAAWFATTQTPNAEENPSITTKSMRALRLYTVATGLLQGRPPWPNTEAQQFLREALQFDSNFASAHILLAHSLANQKRPREEVMAAATRAVETAATASALERAFVEGSFYHLRGEGTVDPEQRLSDLERSVAAYERVIAIEPNHPYANPALTVVYTWLNRDADLMRVRTAHAGNNPDDAILQTWVAMENYRIGEFERAAPYVQRAETLMLRRPDADNSFHATWLQLAAAHRSLLADSVMDALHVVDATTPPAADEASMTVFVRQKVEFYLALGRFAQAESVSGRTPTKPERDDLQLAILAYRGDQRPIRDQLARRYSDASDAARVIWLPLPFGVVEPQLRQLKHERPPSLTGDGAQLVDARVALADGQVDQAIALLQSAQRLSNERGARRAMWISMLLADAWLEKHDTAKAIAALEASTALRSRTTFGASSGAMWLQTRARLAGVYRQTARVADAENIERHLAKLLAVADDDHPLKRSLLLR